MGDVVTAFFNGWTFFIRKLKIGTSFRLIKQHRNISNILTLSSSPAYALETCRVCPL